MLFKRKERKLKSKGREAHCAQCSASAFIAFKKLNRQIRTTVSPIYFIGIGGIGMSALARYFHRRGHIVAGYDKTQSPLTDRLTSEGIAITYIDSISELPEALREAALGEWEIVYTPAIPPSNTIVQWCRDTGHELQKRSEVLGAIANSQRGIAVSGTHGKTTTTAILAHLLTHSGHGCNAFLGGIATDRGTNLLTYPDDTTLKPADQVCVIEADEFDRSFHRLFPEMAIMTNVDPDHLDIYGSEAEFKKAFVDFAENIRTGGHLFLHESVSGVTPEGVHVHTYGLGDDCEIQATEVRVEEGSFRFDLVVGQVEHGTFEMPLPGRHNIVNALAAIGVSMTLGVEVSALKSALSAFSGVKRRFETIVKTARTVYIDDYAHHPSEIDAAIASARELYPSRRLTVAFQPHLFSRTNDFMEAFAASLSKADELILLDIYPAREEPLAGVTSEALASKVSLANTLVLAKEALVAEISGRDVALLLTLGAGDIDRCVRPIAELLTDQDTKDLQ